MSVPDSFHKCLNKFIHGEVVSEAGISTVTPGVFVNCHRILPFVAHQVTL